MLTRENMKVYSLLLKVKHINDELLNILQAELEMKDMISLYALLSTSPHRRKAPKFFSLGSSRA
jgi:hypothetical protein